MIKYQMLISTIKVKIMNQNILSGKKINNFMITREYFKVKEHYVSGRLCILKLKYRKRFCANSTPKIVHDQMRRCQRWPKLEYHEDMEDKCHNF